MSEKDKVRIRELEDRIRRLYSEIDLWLGECDRLKRRICETIKTIDNLETEVIDLTEKLNRAYETNYLDYINELEDEIDE